MKKNKSLLKAMLYRTSFICLLFIYAVFLTRGYKQGTNVVSNVNGVKSIQAVNIKMKYDFKDKSIDVLHVENMKEAKEFGPTMPISFTGQMTAYRPNCVGCTGRVSCPPRQDVTNGNIWYNDNDYGKIRILAADPAIPCGTIVRITNVSFSDDEIIGIVLDRGGAIKGNIMDFLVSETDDMDVVGRQKGVNYEVLRWGW